MKKLMIFPFNNDAEVLLQNKNVCTDFEIIALASYKQDADKLYECQKNYNIYCASFEACCKGVDAVLFVDDSDGSIDQDLSGYEERIICAHEFGLDIYMSKRLRKKLCIKDEVTIFEIEQSDSVELMGRKNKELITPVISILGLGENCSKFALQAISNAVLVDKGYKVLTICSNPLGKFIGMEILPDFLYDNTVTFEDKIKMFNLWIYQQEIKYAPDVIVLGVPGGILPITEFCVNHYSEIALVMANSVLSDAGILTLYHGANNAAFNPEKLIKLCEFKYGVVTEHFVVSDNYYDANYENETVKYYRANKDIVKKPYKGKYLLSDIRNKKGIEDQLLEIIKQLENNVFAI